MKVYGNSDIGLKRVTNQDAFYIECINDDLAFAIVCDGMGGANGGDVASNMAVESIKNQLKKFFENNIQDVSSIKNLLQSSFYNANDLIYKKSIEDPELNGMGTTVIVSIIYKDNLCIAHIGDSRAYIIADNKIEQLTVDHSLVQQMIDTGEITKEEAMHHPNKNLITKALGICDNMPADYIQREIKAGDVLVVCTDGLSNYVSENEIYNCYENNDIRNLTDILVSRAKDLGGNDNITVAILER